MKKHILDACLLEPPEPFVLASAILRTLKSREFLYMTHRRIPYPLFDLAKDLNIEHKIIHQTEHNCVFIFFFDDDLDKLKDEPLLRDFL